jgi:fatty acid desaturase
MFGSAELEGWVAKGGLRVVGREQLAALGVKSNIKGGVQAGSHLAAIAAATWAAATWPGLRLPLLLVQGILVNCLYAGQHELSHWTVFRTKRINDLFGQAFGFATLNPFYADRWAHFSHHRATHDPARDPEILGLPPYTRRSYCLELLAISFWYSRIRTILRHAAGRDFDREYWLSAREGAVVRREARITVALWLAIALVSIALQSTAALVYWLLPLLLTKWFHQLQNLGEHTGLAHQSDTFRNTRTLQGPAWMRWLLWNMSYHTAHHCFPGIPFHALPKLHRAIVANRADPLPGGSYWQVQRDILAGLRKRTAPVEPATP